MKTAVLSIQPDGQFQVKNSLHIHTHAQATATTSREKCGCVRARGKHCARRSVQILEMKKAYYNINKKRNNTLEKTESSPATDTLRGRKN